MRRLSRVTRRILITATVALAFPSAALAAPPVLLSVGHNQLHPTAQWSLPPGVEAAVIEIATSPAQGTDGNFFSENVVDFDLLEDTQTFFTSSSTRLKTGVTYYVHVSGIDIPCYYADGCPVREWSNILTLTIPNVAPDLRAGRWNAYRYLRSGNATLDVCDDEGEYRVVVTQARVRKGKVVARTSSTRTGSISSGGCGSMSVSWSIPAKLIRVGDVYRVSFVVIDPAGLRSRAVGGQSRWR